MEPGQANSPEYERQVIDAEIKSKIKSLDSEESILELKRRRNAISSLPTEIVIIIFSYLRLPGSSPAFSSLPAKAIADLFSSSRLPGAPPLGRLPDHPLSWLHVTQVCHQWREIALNHLPFWTHVDLTNLTLAGVAGTLDRAKGAPLYLEAIIPIDRWDYARINAFTRELQARVSQICHLSINADPFDLLSVFEGLSLPAPTLEYLSLSQPDEPEDSFAVLPHTLFGGVTPRLSSLKLHDVDINWKLPFLNSLKYLEIRAPSATAWANPDWLNALRDMPQLEKLVLHSVSVMANPAQSTLGIQWSALLPSLTHMDISAVAGNCAIILACLFLPALSRLCVTLHSHSVRGSDIPGTFPFLLRHAHGPQDSEPLQSVLISSEKTRATILAWPSPDIDVDVHDPFALLSVALSARVALSITSDSYPQSRYFLQEKAMEALPLGSIVTLTAQHRSRLDEQFWLRHAPKWPLLQCVRLAPPEARGFIEMLLQDNGGRENPLLPSLIELVLVDVKLTARRTDRLCNALMKRAEQGVPLETLEMRKCDVTHFALRLLSEIVVYVWGPAKPFEVWEGIPFSLDATVGGPFVPEEDQSDDSNSSDENLAWDLEEAEINFEDEGEGAEGEDNSDMELD